MDFLKFFFKYFWYFLAMGAVMTFLVMFNAWIFVRLAAAWKTPGIFESLHALGKTRALQRIGNALAALTA